MNTMNKREQLFETHFKLTEQAFQLMNEKNAGYASEEDPFANFRNSAIIAGVSAEKGIMIRIADKLARIKTFLDTGNLNNESFEDSIVDSINYLILLYALMNEEKKHSNDLKCAEAKFISTLPDINIEVEYKPPFY